MDEYGISLEKKEGATDIYYLGKCPLHDDNKPSFAVYPNNNVFVCFSCHPKAGDVIDFVMAYKGVSFKEAVKICTTETDMFTRCEKEFSNFYKPTLAVDTHELQRRATKLGDDPRNLDIHELVRVLSRFDEFMSDDRWINADQLLRMYNV